MILKHISVSQCPDASSSVTPTAATLCNGFAHIISSIGSISTCLGTYLFLVRVKGVFSQQRASTYVFNTLWLLAVAGVITTIPFAFFASNDKFTGLCTISRIDSTEVVGSITVGVFDFVVFLSISYKVTGTTRSTRGHLGALFTFFSGSRNRPICKALLRTGQLYFL